MLLPTTAAQYYHTHPLYATPPFFWNHKVTRRRREYAAAKAYSQPLSSHLDRSKLEDQHCPFSNVKVHATGTPHGSDGAE